MAGALPNVVVVGDPHDPLLEALATREDATYTVSLDAQVLAAAAATADAILSFWASRELLDGVLTSAPQVRWVHSIATGLDRIMSPALAAHPSLLTNTRDVFSPALAEFALLGMLYFAKNVPRLERARAAATWDPFEVETLAGKVLGLVGFGSIGQATARLAAAHRMKVRVHRRQPAADPDVALVTDRGELFATADYVVLAAPLTPETRHLAGAPELARMKSTAVLINVGRGALVDEQALIDVLSKKAIRGAALDVFETEPLPARHPFFTMENVLLSPHCADRTATWLGEALALFTENLARFHAGMPLLHPVDKARGY